MPAVFYRAPDGSEPVNDLIDALPRAHQAALDLCIDRLNLLTPSMPHLGDRTANLLILIHCSSMDRREISASPIGSAATDAARRRAAASAAYRSEWARLDPYEAIARQVIALRAQHGLSQEALAERIGTSYSQISRIESGQHRTSVETLRRIADAFEVSLVIKFEPRAAA